MDPEARAAMEVADVFKQLAGEIELLEPPWLAAWDAFSESPTEQAYARLSAAVRALNTAIEPRVGDIARLTGNSVDVIRMLGEPKVALDVWFAGAFEAIPLSDYIRKMAELASIRAGRQRERRHDLLQGVDVSGAAVAVAQAVHEIEVVDADEALRLDAEVPRG